MPLKFDDRRNRISIFARFYGTAVLLLCLLALTGCEAIWTLLRDDRRPDRYLIPEGFVGWVRIDYEVDDAAKLDTEDGFNVYRIPPSGHLQTSSGLEEGWATDEYYYLSPSGSRERIYPSVRGGGGLIWRAVVGYHEIGGTRVLDYRHFFVGPEELAQRQPSQRQEDEPFYGPVSQVEP